jgi:hypothetical protein
MLNKVPDYEEFCDKFAGEFPAPGWEATSKEYEDWDAALNAAWDEVVNQALLGENITGACVIGGFALAALKAGQEVPMMMLFTDNRHFNTAFSISSMNNELVSILLGFTNLTFDDLYTCQRINDSTNPTVQQLWNYTKEGYEDNPAFGKTAEDATVLRRTLLKEFIQSRVG